MCMCVLKFVACLYDCLSRWSVDPGGGTEHSERSDACRWAPERGRRQVSLNLLIILLLYIYMIAASRAWLGWLLYYYLHCPLIDVSCLTRILLFVYALTWVCNCYMIFTWLLNAWVISLVIEYSDDEYGWGRVSATIGVGLRSRAIVVIDLSRWVCWGLRIVVVLTSHLTLVHSHSTLYGQGIG
jgi:hypothetical protein